MKELVHYVQDVFDIAHSYNLDEGAFQAYLMIGKSMIVRALRYHNVQDLFVLFQEYLDSFKLSWELTSGGSLELLWEMFRPPTAKSRRELDLLLQCEDVADRFDYLTRQSKIPIDGLADLRRSIVLLKPLQSSVDGTNQVELKASYEDISNQLPMLMIDRPSSKLLPTLKIV